LTNKKNNIRILEV